MNGDNLLDSGGPVGAPWNLRRAGAFGDWLVWMVHPRGKEKVVAVIEAYCDESGIHDGAHKCAVAGWVGSTRNWQLFEDRWFKACRGVEFHGKEFFARHAKGAYGDWTDKEALAYLNRLIDVILSSSLKPVGGLVDTKAFKALSLDERKWLTGATWSPVRQRFTTSGAPTKPYYLGFIDCLEGAAANVKKSGWQVNFVFDQQHVLAPWAMKFFQTAKAATNTPLAPRLGDAIFKSKNGVGGLQAADLLAHSLYRVFSARFTGANVDEPRIKAIQAAFDSLVRGRIANYDERALKARLSERYLYMRQRG